MSPHLGKGRAPGCLRAPGLGGVEGWAGSALVALGERQSLRSEGGQLSRAILALLGMVTELTYSSAVALPLLAVPAPHVCVLVLVPAQQLNLPCSVSSDKAIT